MKARPILFSGPMIQALLAGRKTQTRRIIKQQPQGHHWASLPGYQLHVTTPMEFTNGKIGIRYFHSIPQNRERDYDGPYVYCPYGKPGNLLWVRETTAVRSSGWNSETGHWYCVDYAAGGVGCGIRHGHAPSFFPSRSHNANGVLRWQPSIHMPRWASRLTLRITDVRVQRLQEIGAADAIAEGLDVVLDGGSKYGINGLPDTWNDNPRLSYLALWDAINGAGAASANPYIWGISFEVIQKNVDQVLREMKAA